MAQGDATVHQRPERCRQGQGRQRGCRGIKETMGQRIREHDAQHAQHNRRQVTAQDVVTQQRVDSGLQVVI